MCHFMHYAGVKMKQDPVKIWPQNSSEFHQLKSPEKGYFLQLVREVQAESGQYPGAGWAPPRPRRPSVPVAQEEC